MVNRKKLNTSEKNTRAKIKGHSIIQLTRTCKNAKYHERRRKVRSVPEKMNLKNTTSKSNLRFRIGYWIRKKKIP